MNRILRLFPHARQSKAIANAYTRDCAARYTDLLINACTPGFIETDLGTEFLGDRTPAEAGMKTPTDGARVILSLLFDDVKGSGHYYGSDARGQRLWLTSGLLDRAFEAGVSVSLPLYESSGGTFAQPMAAAQGLASIDQDHRSMQADAQQLLRDIRH